MIAAISSTLTWNLIVICLVWITGIIIIQVIKFSLLKSLNTVADGNDPENADTITAKMLAQRVRVKQGAKIFNIAITAAAAITLLVFLLFMNNNRVKPGNEVKKIEQAPLPEKFKQMTPEEIKQSNEQAVTAKTVELQKKATEENTKAMDDGINIFKKAK